MCDDELGDTGAFLKALDNRYENLDSGWVKTFLKELNERVGWIKQNLSGNVILQVPWRGGKPGGTNWLVKMSGKPKS